MNFHLRNFSKYDNNVDKAESRILLDQKFKNDVEKYFGVNGELNE